MFAFIHHLQGFCFFLTVFLWSMLFTPPPHTHTHPHLSTRTVPTADPALFHVVDGQGEADLERPVPCLLHQFGLYHLHGESREAEGGSVLQHAAFIWMGSAVHVAVVLIPGQAGVGGFHQCPQMGRGWGSVLDPRGLPTPRGIVPDTSFILTVTHVSNLSFTPRSSQVLFKTRRKGFKDSHEMNNRDRTAVRTGL